VPAGSGTPRCVCNHGFAGAACDVCQTHFAGSSCERCETNYIGYNTDCSVLCVHGEATEPGQKTRVFTCVRLPFDVVVSLSFHLYSTVICVALLVLFPFFHMIKQSIPHWSVSLQSPHLLLTQVVTCASVMMTVSKVTGQVPAVSSAWWDGVPLHALSVTQV
jgi:hypothetical protein